MNTTLKPTFLVILLLSTPVTFSKTVRDDRVIPKPVHKTERHSTIDIFETEGPTGEKIIVERENTTIKDSKNIRIVTNSNTHTLYREPFTAKDEIKDTIRQNARAVKNTVNNGVQAVKNGAHAVADAVDSRLHKSADASREAARQGAKKLRNAGAALEYKASDIGDAVGKTVQSGIEKVGYALHQTGHNAEENLKE